MQLRTKLLFSLLVLLLTTTLLIYTNYTIHKTGYHEMIEYSIESAVDKIKHDIQKADEIITNVASFKQNVFYNLHEIAYKRMRQNPNLNLVELKKELMELLPHKFVNIEVYLINRHYRIYQSTYRPDLNLNMRNFLGAKEYIDKAFSQIGTIIFAKQPSFDIQTNEYKIYSYLAINSETILELGFFDRALSQIKDRLYAFNLQDSIIKDVDIYADYGKYIINISKESKASKQSKEEYMQDLLKNRDKFVSQMVTNQGKYHYDFEENGRFYRVCYRYIDRTQISITQFKHYVLRAKVDITTFYEQLMQLKYALYFTSMTVFVFIVFLVIFFMQTIIKPFKLILDRFISAGSIEDDNMLAKNDEFGTLSCNINKMSSQLSFTQQEVDKKTFELKIANEQLKNFNVSLQDRIKDEVAKNRLKDQQLLAQSRLAQMGEMIAMIAHQWRQPLSAINSIALNLQFKCSLNQAQVDPNLVAQNVEDISKYALHLSETIDDFRDFFKPHKSMRETTFDEIIHSVYKIMQESLEVHSITIVEELECHESFIAYPNELKHVLLNLLKNAQDAFIENDTPNRTIIVRTYLDKSQKVLEVQDNAGGIASDIISKIFDPYFSTKSNRNGTGLGLYMSKMIIEKHSSGRLKVSSKEEQTTFTIIL